MIQNTPLALTHSAIRTRGFAAVFIDFENIFYFLKAQYADVPDLNDYIFHILRSLKKHLETHFSLQSIIEKAYADFERIKSTPQGSLYLMGIETQNVMGTEHKNAADMKLCIDALEVLYTRPEIETFIFLAGDRDYIPVIQHLKKQGRAVLTVAFRGSISGDLLMNVGAENFIDAITLFDPDVLKRLEDASQRQRDYEAAEHEREEQRRKEAFEREEQKRLPTESDTTRGKEKTVFRTDVEIASQVERSTNRNWQNWIREVRQHPLKINFTPPMPITGVNERLCLDVLLKNYGRHSEVWMSPFLRKLTDAFPSLADFERKSLLSTLESSGAIHIEKRQGEPYDYTVIVINYNHPTVREMNPG